MNGMSRLAIVDPDPQIANVLAAVCADAGFPISSRHDSTGSLLADDAAPDVAVLDCTAADGDPAAAVRALLQRWPELCVIVTGTSPAAMSHAVAMGARGFLLKPYGARDLVAVLRESLASARLLGHTARPRGRIVAVYSPKGGSGCSTIAVGLAVMTAARPHTSVALVDLDLQFGDVDVMLDIRSPNSIADLVGHERLDAAIIEETFVRHGSGLRVLAAPRDLASVANIRPDAVDRTLDALRDHFDVIVCDLWSSLDDLTTRVLRSADHVVLVTKPELPSLRSLSRVLAAKQLVDLDGHAFVVANRMPGRGGLTSEEVEHSLARHISVAIPSDGAVVVDAINRGLSVVDPRVRSRVQQTFGTLAHAVWEAIDLERPAEPQLALAHA